MAISLSQIVPWSRSRREYELMFALKPADLEGGVLDCGGGPASFTAEMCAAGFHAVSVDPIYQFSKEEIQARFEAVADTMITQVRATPGDWIWSYHSGPDDLCRNRRLAIETFLSHYQSGLRLGRYVRGELPSLPFASRSFGLAVCSHLLFLYSDLLSEEFHVRSVVELCRLAREVRIFPLLTLAGAPSPHVGAVQSAVQAKHWAYEIIRVDYELQRGGNQMLRIWETAF